jgi:hypothetical protein
MARLMGRDRSTIWRELKRKMIQTWHGLRYCVSKAQEQRNGRLRRSRRGPQHSLEDYALVRRLLLQQWSPEQISGTLGRLNELQISHQTIYRYLRRDWGSGGNLWQELRRRYKRRKRHYGLEKRGRLQGKPMIGARPETCVVTVVERANVPRYRMVVHAKTVTNENQLSPQRSLKPSADIRKMLPDTVWRRADFFCDTTCRVDPHTDGHENDKRQGSTAVTIGPSDRPIHPVDAFFLFCSVKEHPQALDYSDAGQARCRRAVPPPIPSNQSHPTSRRFTQTAYSVYGSGFERTSARSVRTTFSVDFEDHGSASPSLRLDSFD